MRGPVIPILSPAGEPTDSDAGLTREWLVTNGLGGYASGTLLGRVTRRYHGYLVAALPAPFGRVMMFNDLLERVELPNGNWYQLGGEERSGTAKQQFSEHKSEFRLDAGLPVWRFELGEAVIEKRLVLVHGQNTVHINYRLLTGADQARLILRPSVHFRPHEDPVSVPLEGPYALMVAEEHYEISLANKLPPLKFLFNGSKAQLTMDKLRTQEIVYRIEERRGYPARGDLWSPGYFHAEIRQDREATLVASTESWEDMEALAPAEAIAYETERRRRLVLKARDKVEFESSGAAADDERTISELVLASDQFLITPAGRVQDAARARAVGDEVRTLIAGYHWFTDWGRDTMISLEGLTLTPGRFTQAAWILRTFAHYIRDGLIPNMFPEGKSEGLYHTADATLWFFHAIDRYTEVSGDRSVIKMVLPKLVDIFWHHMRGTRFGIGVDPSDGLLKQGADGYALTWMDAKMDDWVVTPRRGKPVEINALWYNALRLLEGWLTDEQSGMASTVREAAEKAKKSFNERFWSPKGQFLYDIVDGPDGDDPACRPNQLLAVSLKHPVLDPANWKAVVEIARAKLVTPVGLRSLSPDHKDYKASYDGDLRTRDGAYHQGTVWAWLIGPFIDAFVKVYPEDKDGAKEFLQGFVPHLREACVGSISEIFDAEPPFTPRGCVAQAWSVAEVLRCWIKLSAG